MTKISRLHWQRAANPSSHCTRENAFGTRHGRMFLNHIGDPKVGTVPSEIRLSTSRHHDPHATVTAIFLFFFFRQ